MVNLGTARTKWYLAAAVFMLSVTVIVAVVGLGPAHGGRAVAATQPSADDTVAVSGVGIVQGVPDTLRASFGVHVTRPDVQSTLDAEASAMRHVLDALKQHGLSGRAVQTTNLSLGQHWDNHGNISGYEATETVSASISPLGSAGKAISTAASASGNNVSIDGLSFDITDDHALLNDARGKAFADAHDRAAQYAGLAHRSLGSVMKVSETVTSQQPVPQQYYQGLSAAAGPAAKSLAIRPGQQPVTVTVTVIWRLK